MSSGVSPNKDSSGLVTFTIKIDGTELSDQYNVASVSITKEINRIPFAKITLYDGDVSNGEFPASDGEDLIPGNEVEILAGYESKLESIFKGIIVKQGLKIKEGQDSVLLVECRDKASILTVDRKSAYFHDVKDSDAINTIVSDAGLEADITDTTVTHTRLIQYSSTDWDFIVVRAEVNGQLIIVNDGKVSSIIPDSSLETPLTITYGLDLYEFEAEIDSRTQIKSASAYSWSPADQDLISSDSADPSLESSGNLDADTLSKVLDISPFNMYNSGEIISDEIKAWADARILKSRIAKIQGRIKFQGNALALPGTYIELEKVGERYNGKAFVSGIRHIIQDGNWFTNAQIGHSDQWFIRENNVSELPASGLLPAVNGLHVGIVTQLQDDPDSEERVMVKIPSINNEDEGIWARIATLDAGENRGSFFRPEIDDEVVVGYFNDDPRNPVILGMLNSSSKPAPLKASDDNFEKGFITKSELKLLFDDDKKTIVLETPNGNKITMSDDDGGITFEDENGNKVEMNSDGINIESSKDLIIKASGDVNIEGTNINIKSSADLKLDGGAGAEFSTSAIAVVKGSLVQIN